MKILNKLTLNNIKLNKQRTVVTIVGIMLSCALITALFTLLVSFQDTLMEQSLKSDGNRHVTFEDVPGEELSKIQNHNEVADYYMSGNKTIRLNTKYHEFGGLIGIEEKGLLDLENLLDSGRVPENENEIVVDLYYANRFATKIGDEITVEVGKRYSEGYELRDGNPVNYGENYTLLETFEVSEEKTYEVVGISNYYTFLGTMYPYNLYTLENDFSEVADIHVLYKNPKDYLLTTNFLNGVSEGGEGSSFEEPGIYFVDYNSEYLRWAGYSINDNTREFIYLFAGVITFIIILTSVFCIKNSFAISTTEKTKMYGILASVGATPRQIKKSVLTEGFYLGIIGIPLGIIFGLFVTFILILVVNYLLPEWNSFDFMYRISLFSIIISILLSSVTIYASALGSAKKASRISEIEAIKNQNEIKIKNKSTSCPKIIRKVFKIGGVFAYKNVKRNKSKFKTITISLAVSVTMFIALSYFMHLGMETTNEYYKNISYDLRITAEEATYDKENIEDTYEELLTQGKANEYSIIEFYMFNMDEKYVNEKRTGGSDPTYSIEFTAVGDSEYKRILKENNLNYEDVYNKGLILNNRVQFQKEDGEWEWISLLKEGISSIEFVDVETNITRSIDLVDIENLPIGSEEYATSMSYPILLVSNEYLDSITGGEAYISSLFLTTDNIEEYHNKIVEYSDTSGMPLSVHNMEEVIEVQENIVLLVGIFLYGFIGVIILISLTNIFNTITTNMKLRSKEFAILRSIGMTDEEFIHMIRLESIFYGSKSLLYGITFGIFFAYLMYYLMVEYEMSGSGGEALSFQVPWIYILLTIVFVFFIINLIMRVSLSKISKQNTIETIKNENI